MATASPQTRQIQLTGATNAFQMWAQTHGQNGKVIVSLKNFTIRGNSFIKPH